MEGVLWIPVAQTPWSPESGAPGVTTVWAVCIPRRGWVMPGAYPLVCRSGPQCSLLRSLAATVTGPPTCSVAS